MGALAVPTIRELFVFEGLRWLYILLFAFLGAGALTPLMTHLSHQWGLVDQPSERKIHVHPTPRLGGVAVYLGFLGSVLLNSILPDWMIATLAAGSLLLIVGLIDDVWELPAASKLAAQLAGCRDRHRHRQGADIVSERSNRRCRECDADVALDRRDHKRVQLFSTAWMAWPRGWRFSSPDLWGRWHLKRTSRDWAGWPSPSSGQGIGFLPYNFRGRKPAVIFLGDGGATFLGFTLACLAVKGNWADHSPIVSFSNPLLIFGVLIYDMVHITVERVATGKVRSIKEWLDYVGKDHLHHRLERALGSRQASVAMIFLMTICLGLAALALRRAGTAEACYCSCKPA